LWTVLFSNQGNAFEETLILTLISI
jgi:hypothetical protein